MVVILENLDSISDDQLEDAFDYYINNVFGYKGIENFVDINYPQYPEKIRKTIINYIRNQLR